MRTDSAGSPCIFRRALVPALLLALAACASMHESEDFERHRFSQVTVPYDRPDVIYFDVKITAVYPADDELAEQKRMEWLEQWMKQRRLCPAGHEILKRRKFEYTEDNPAHYDLRYEVRCSNEPPG